MMEKAWLRFSIIKVLPESEREKILVELLESPSLTADNSDKDNSMPAAGRVMIDR